MNEKQARDFVMSVKLTPDMREKLAYVSKQFGQSPATVASFAIGQYIATQSVALNASENIANKFVSALSPGLTELLNKLTESEPCLSSKECSEPLPQ